MRISRKRIHGRRIEIFRRDLFNPPQPELTRDDPKNLEAIIKLGVFEATFHKYIYIISFLPE